MPGGKVKKGENVNETGQVFFFLQAARRCRAARQKKRLEGSWEVGERELIRHARGEKSRGHAEALPE